MRKRHRWVPYMITTVCMVLAASFLSYGAPRQLKSVTYVSDAWVINFWNTESDHMEEELAQIAADGFNSIVLAVPWREFQPGLHPVQYNDYAFKKLDRIMRIARDQGLWVILRVGYTWDYSGEEACQTRYRRLLSDGSVRAGWLEYAGKLYQSASRYENFYGGFMTWEDFWNYTEEAPAQFASRGGADEARNIGFQRYLQENHTLEEVNRYFSPAVPFSGFDQVGIPAKDSPAYKLFLEYYDHVLIDLLTQTQRVFPNLSMEVLDVDPVEGMDGGRVGAVHYQTFPCAGASYTSLMYSVAMGQPFNRVLSAGEAVAMMDSQLRVVKAYNGGKPIYIDQLLYMDMTPGFEHNARLSEGERNGFLTGISGILQTYTNGYGIWSYRNYANNGLYNSQFALGDKGWGMAQAQVVWHNDSHQAMLRRGGSISQFIGSRLPSKQKLDNHVRFTADSETPVRLSVSLGSKTQEVTVEGPGQYDLSFGNFEYDQVQFRCDSDVYLDNISVYNFVQDGQIYDLDGNGLPCLAGVRELNRRLAE